MADAPAAADVRLRPDARIRRRADFQLSYGRGARIAGRYSTLFALPNQRPVGRLGIAATRKFGDAVRRNRAKRLIREVFRRNKVVGFDVVVVPKRELLHASLVTLEEDYRRNLARGLDQARHKSR